MQDAIIKSAGGLPRVVILEDDDGVRRSLQLLLQGRGFAVKAYGSSRSLLADPELDGTACLVADYRLPEMDGITVLERLRARGWWAPAILVTAFGSQDLMTRANKAGFSEVIEKPFKDHALILALERLT
jgi:FixJ family two-component response regulator